MDQKGAGNTHNGDIALENQSSLRLPSPQNIHKNSISYKNKDNLCLQQKNQFGRDNSYLDLLKNSHNSHQQANHNNELEGEGEGWQKLDQTKKELDDVVKDLDVKLNRVLDKQEYDYLNGYNMYVKKKERELRELIQKMSDKNSNSTIKDDRILNLEKRMEQQRDHLIKSEQQKEDLRGKLKMWKVKAQEFEKDKDFLYKQVMDSKKKNRLLKIAVSRLQAEIDKNEVPEEPSGPIDKGDTFLTDLYQLGGSVELNETHRLNTQVKNGDQSILMLDQSILQSSLKDGSILSSNKKPHKRYQSTGISRYANIPTENLKFTKFVDLLFKSKMHQDDVREELKKYVQAIETNYTEKIKEMNVQMEKFKRKIKNMNGEKATQVTEKNEFESLFVLCIEDTRRDIMKRRLKNELVNRKKQIAQIAQNEEDAKEFEDSLLKLANLAKNRVKQSDFTMRDRCNMLDLFVNNEKTLLKMYEILFPHRVNANQNNKQGVATSQQQAYASQQKSIDLLKSQQNSIDNSLMENSQMIKLDTTAETIKETRFLPTINNSKIYHDTSMYASQGNKSDYASLRNSQVK